MTQRVECTEEHDEPIFRKLRNHDSLHTRMLVGPLYARHHVSEGQKTNKPVELEELMNSRKKSDVSIIIKILLSKCRVEFQAACFGINGRRDVF